MSHATGRLTVYAVLRRHGCSRVTTDRALAYTRSHAFRAALDEVGARHLTTRPYRPRMNGKVERFRWRRALPTYHYVWNTQGRLPYNASGGGGE